MVKNTIRNFPFTRNFGIELEFFNVSRAEAARALTAADVRWWDSYSQSTGTGWKIYDDGSINGNNSIELVSPILSGRSGLREVARVVKQFARAGARVNKSCGFHVHVDARTISGEHMRNVYLRYALHETQIDAFMVQSRRGNVNEYCRSTQGSLGLLSATDNNSTAHRVASAMSERWDGYMYQGGRYNKVNLCAFLRHGTIEFRQHSGTMNVDKVINWIVFCVNFVETSANTSTAEIYTNLNTECAEFFTSRTAALANPASSRSAV
jgi:hypothetical protein